MAYPAGKATPTYKNGILDTNDGQTFTIPAGNTAMSTVFNSGLAQKLTANAAGTVWVQRAGDAAAGNWCSYVMVAGQSITGNIATVGGTGQGSTAISVTVES